MLVFIENDAFGDVTHGAVYFRDANGTRIRAAIADSTNDWDNTFIVTTVPTGTADSSMIWVETATGVDSIEFSLIQNGVFSPSTISWTATTPLPQPLQGLNALFVPIEEGTTPANYVFTVGGADTLNKATTAVYRGIIAQSGALGAWNTSVAQLPEARAYHATVGATAYTAAIDTTVGGFLYALGGKDGNGTTVNTVFYGRVELDGSLTSWQSATSLPVPLHGASAVVLRGFIYLAGGADSSNAAQTQVYRAAVRADGSLGMWESVTSLPEARSHFSLVSFGPYLYAVGGETGSSAPVSAAQTGTETANTHLARINLRNGSITSAGWTALETMSKARSKHSSLFAGGALFVTSGIYAGIGTSGSSENTYATVNSDGTIGSWQGATNAQTINSAIGYSLYNQVMVTFIDNAGTGHIVVIGGAKTSTEGSASDKVIYY